jgi:thiol-disulfide isomerase/thioredoxin
MSLTGCKNNKYALEFKEEYESINGVVNKNGKEHRAITIDEDNPYIKTTPEEIVKMINNKETFFLYVGDSLCPWCRSVLEKSIEVAKKYNVEKIYYIKIWDDEGNEILRDKYELKPILTKTIEGTDSYKFLLEKFDSVLSEYTLTDTEGHKITTEEKRIYAPNYFYIKNGEVVKMVEGISEKQTDSREELTDEILKDEEEQFISLFKLNK